MANLKSVHLYSDEAISIRPADISEAVAIYIDLLTGMIIGFMILVFSIFLFRYSVDIHIEFNKKGTK